MDLESVTLEVAEALADYGVPAHARARASRQVLAIVMQAIERDGIREAYGLPVRGHVQPASYDLPENMPAHTTFLEKIEPLALMRDPERIAQWLDSLYKISARPSMSREQWLVDFKFILMRNGSATYAHVLSFIDGLLESRKGK